MGSLIVDSNEGVTDTDTASQLAVLGRVVYLNPSSLPRGCYFVLQPVSLPQTLVQLRGEVPLPLEH